MTIDLNPVEVRLVRNAMEAEIAAVQIHESRKLRDGQSVNPSVVEHRRLCAKVWDKLK